MYMMIEDTQEVGSGRIDDYIQYITHVPIT